MPHATHTHTTHTRTRTHRQSAICFSSAAEQRGHRSNQFRTLEGVADACRRLLFDGNTVRLTLPQVSARIAEIEAAINDYSTQIGEFKDAFAAQADAIRSNPAVIDEHRLFLTFHLNPAALPALCRQPGQ
eukprot:m.19316 g.19316  ORF g.19316 m.19316 type:complete len:130 (+) comp3424_c0_seq2:1509-1898(+)